MTTATKAIAGLGGLLATATVPSTYLAISSFSSNSGNSEETTKVDNRKAGTRWLTSGGYTPNKPTFKYQDSLRHGCSENLFSNSKGSFDPSADTKLYGCAVMNMSLWNTGMRLSDIPYKRNDIDPKWIQFNSEIAIRKGNEGWIINARFDNLFYDSQDSLAYMLTTYKYEDNEWRTNGEPKLWIDKETTQGDLRSVKVSDIFMTTSDDILMIKSPEDIWFNKSDWAFDSDNSQTKIKKHVRTKNWSGVWIDDANNGKDSWIFENIELYVGDKKYSKVFCKGEGDECFQSRLTNLGSVKNPSATDTWSKATQGGYNGEQVKNVIPTTVKEIMGKLKDSKGSWERLESICESEGEPDDKQQEFLKMYCASGKAAS